MLVLHCPSAGQNEGICEARWLTADEKQQYTEEAAETTMVCTKIIAELPYYSKCPASMCSGSFPGGYNRNFIISQDEADAIIAENAAAMAKVKAQEREERIEDLQYTIRRAEQQKTIPTAEEAREMRRQYNELHNEGGEGYVPYWITKEDYEEAKRDLANIKGDD